MILHNARKNAVQDDGFNAQADDFLAYIEEQGLSLDDDAETLRAALSGENTDAEPVNIESQNQGRYRGYSFFSVAG